MIVGELSQDGSPWEKKNLGSFFTMESAEVAGVPVTFTPTIGPQSYPSSWQAWRYETPPYSSPQPFELWITADLHIRNKGKTFSAYFLPGQRN